VLALEPLTGQRIVASAEALDAVAWPAGVTALRFAPDDVFVLGAQSFGVSGEHMIVVDESGFAGCWLDADGVTTVTKHIDWQLPTERPALAQGFVAGVPAKIFLGAGGEVLLLCNAAYAADLVERLS